MNRLFNRLVLLMMLASFGGCVHVDVALLPDAKMLTELPPEHGVLAVRVVDLGHGRPFSHLTVASTDSENKRRSKPQRFGTQHIDEFGVSMFIGVVRAGHYSLADLFGAGPLLGSGGSRRIAGDALGTFTVEAAGLTQLGTIYYYPQPQADGHRDVLTRSDLLPGLEALLETEYSVLLPSLENVGSPLGWLPDSLANRRLDIYRAAAQNPIAFDRAVAFDDEVVILSRAGALLRQGRDGRWTTVQLDTDTPVATFDKNKHNDAVATSSDGKLFIRMADTEGWQTITSPAVDGRFVAAMFGDDNVVRAFLAHRDTLSIVERHKDAGTEWQVRKVFRKGGGWNEFDPDRDTRSVADVSGKPSYKPLTGLSFANKGHMLLFTVQRQTYSFDERSGNVERVTHLVRGVRAAVNGEAWTIAGHVPYVPLVTNPPPVVPYWSEETDSHWRVLTGRFNRCPGETNKARSTHCADNRTRKYGALRHSAPPLLTEDGVFYSIMITADMESAASISPVTLKLAMFMPPVWLQDKPHYLSHRLADGKNWSRITIAEGLPAGCNKVFPSSRDGTLIIGCSGTSGRLYEYSIEQGTYTLVHEPGAFRAPSEASAAGAN